MEIREACRYEELNRDNNLSCTNEDPCTLCELRVMDPEVKDESR